MPPNGVPIGGGFTEGELQFASFWVRNRIVLARLGRLALIGVNILLWGFVAWSLLDAYVISYPREARITSEIAANQITLGALESDQPKNVAVGGVLVLPTTDGRYDMSVDMENANEQWWAEFNYRFNLSGEQTPLRNGFVMPRTKTVVTELGFKPRNRGGAVAQLIIENVRWHRVDPSMVGSNYKDFEINRFNVAFENVKFNNDLVLGSKRIGQTSFDVVNRGSFGYWGLDLVIRLYRGASVVAINRLTVPELTPGETRHIEFGWFDAIPAVTKTEIIPSVNFLDPGTYLPTERFRK